MMRELTDSRVILRILHNCIFFASLMASIALSVYDRQDIPVGTYMPQLLLAALFISLFFIYSDAVLAWGGGFFLFSIRLLIGLAAMFFASYFIMGANVLLMFLITLTGVVNSGMVYYEHNRGKRTFYPTPAVIILYVFVFLIGNYLKDTKITGLAVGSLIAEIVIFILYHEFTNLEFSIKQVRDRAYVPTEVIRKQNRYELAFFLLPTAIVTGLCFLFPYSSQVADFLFKVLTKLTGLILRLIYFLATLMPMDDSETGSQTDFSKLPMDLSEKSSKLWDIIFALAGIGLALLIAWALVRTVIEFYKRFMRTGVSDDDVVSEFVNPDEKRGGGLEKTKISFFDRSPAARIRRRYIHFIKKHPGSKEIASSDTPTQLEEKALGEARASYTGLHDLYEKVRYSDKECSAADVSNFNGMARS